MFLNIYQPDDQYLAGKPACFLTFTNIYQESWGVSKHSPWPRRVRATYFRHAPGIAVITGDGAFARNS